MPSITYLDPDGIGRTAVLVGGAATPGIVEVTSTPYTVLASGEYILINPSPAAATTINLPAGASHTTKVLVIKDKMGVASTKNITIVANGAQTIDGAASHVLIADYGSVTLVFSGTEWSIT